MRVLFCTPPISLEERYGSFAGGGSSAPSLGVLLLAAVARQDGHEVAVVEAAALELSLPETLRRVAAFAPDVLGISSTSLSILHAAALADAAKQALPDLTVLIGGPHVSAVPIETMQRCPGFDVAVIGEGEATVAVLLQALADGGAPADVAGIVYRDPQGLQTTAPRPVLRDLDRLPLPAWDLLEGFPERYAMPAFKVRQLPAATLVSSRGCPNTCIFCDRSVFGATCHLHSAGYVVDMIRTLHQRFGVREFSFEDDTFVTFKPRLKEICEQLIALDAGLTWSCLGRVDHVTPDNLALMKKAGCWQVSYGIESGDQQILERIGKRVTLDQVRQAVQWTRDAGLNAKGFFIVGHPGETRETLEATRRLALELPLNDISITMLTPFPGTELAARAAEFGSFDDDWRKLNLLNAVFVPHGLTRQELEQAQTELTKAFYLRPRVVRDYLGRFLRNPRMLPGLVRGFKAVIGKR